MVEISRSKGDLEHLKLEEEKTKHDTVEGLKEQLTEKEKEALRLKKEAEERLSQSSQVASMKKIIQQKNEQVNSLKERYCLSI
ncbi:MAG: hypothetical protein P4L67_05350 [Candidatus Pacebacteria bacterium]|nr:hypothetical protein [Candidatus Paceibacterota bacterium]